jgi:hypothetical protein
VGPVDQYRLEVVRAIGATTLSVELAALMPGCPVGRSEIESVRPAAVTFPALQGSLDVRLSSTDGDADRLAAGWARSPWRVALVLLFSQHPAFWAEPKERREPVYLGWPRPPHGAGSRLMGRVLRRLYRCRALPASQWDYIAYLEMQPEDVAHVREHLTELRDPKKNLPRAQVAREVELWMTKQVDPSGTCRLSERLSDRIRDRLGA